MRELTKCRMFQEDTILCVGVIVLSPLQNGLPFAANMFSLLLHKWKGKFISPFKGMDSHISMTHENFSKVVNAMD